MVTSRKFRVWFLILNFATLAVVSAACTRAPIKNLDQAMRPARERRPPLTDDLGLGSLLSSLKDDLKMLKAKSIVTMKFGPREVARAEYVKALEFLVQSIEADETGAKFRQALSEKFEAYEVYGRKDWSEIFMTSYFEPVMDGSLKKSDRFSQPLYTTPRDLVEVDLKAFAGLRPALEQATPLRGQLVTGAGLPKIVPYPPREQIDQPDGMKGRAEILAWADPIDAFMLEVQGSGVLKLEGGKEMPIGYASQNGHPYVSIGKFLFDKIPREKMSLQTLEAYLRSAGPEESRRLMNLNPSHVFFRKLERAGLTYFGTEVVPGRTVATDATYFPKGALAYLEFDRPVFSTPQATEPSLWQKTSRFVLDQDTGGAIRGPDRLDLFWGRGAEAKQAAGVMKNSGRLWYFVPREEFLKELRGAAPQGGV